MCLSENKLYGHIGKQIKLLRIKNSLSQYELGMILDCNRVSLSKIESGKQYCQLYKLYQLCYFFNLPLSYFLPKGVDTDSTFIRIGDIVELKSGSDRMTVTQISNQTIKCQWFNNGILVNESFISKALRVIN